MAAGLVHVATPTDVVQFISSTAANSEYFGTSLDATDDYLVVGSKLERAFIFERIASAWVEVLAIMAPVSGQFGAAVAVGGDVVVIGAPAYAAVYPNGPGAVYVYRRIVGVWTLTHTIINPVDPLGYTSQFGRNISITPDGSVFVVGCMPTSTSSQGHAHVFKYNAGTGAWDGTDLVDPGNLGYYFGTAVAISDDGLTIVVGEHRDRVSGTSNVGSACVFEWDGSTWVLTKLFPSTVIIGIYFGQGVGISSSGDTIAVTAPYFQYYSVTRGKLFVFQKVLGVWTQVYTNAAYGGPRYHKQLGLGSLDRLNGGTNELLFTADGSVLVQALQDDGLGFLAAGRVCVFTPSPDWTSVVEHSVYPHYPQTSDLFGLCRFADGKLLVGAPGVDGIGGSSNCGVVWEIDQADLVWMSSGADTTAPTVTLVSPPNLSAINPGDPIVIDVTDDVALGHVEIRVKLGNAINTDSVFNGVSFLGLYEGVSSTAPIAGGTRYTLQRTGGWPSSVRVTVDAFDTSGNKFV